MNIPKKRPHYQAIRAFADGWTIQCRDPHSNNPEWGDAFHDFDVNYITLFYDFRIVPDKDGWIPFYAHEESECPVDGEVVVVVEWVDDWVVKTKKTKANEIEWDDIDNPIIRYHIVEKPKTKKMWQWIIKRGKARPEATFEYYSSEKELMEDLNPLDVVIIQRADWTCIEVEL